MLIRCTQAGYLNQQIIGVCIDSKCHYQRPYCNFCLPNHDQHLNKLTSLELLDRWINKRVLIAHTVQQKAQECQQGLDSLLIQFHTLGPSQIDNIIKGLCLIVSCEKLLLNQFYQSIEQIKQIIKEILENHKKQTNLSSNDNLQIQKPFEMKELNFGTPKHLNKPNVQPFTLSR